MTDMKKILTLFAVISLLASCDFLKERPTTSLSDEVAYGTEGALEAQIFGVLRGFAGDAMITGNMNEFLMSCSGLIHWGAAPTYLTDAQQRWTCSFAFTQYAMHPYNYNEYKGFYNVVNRANRLLEHLPDSPVGDAYKKEIEGEARFYRGLAYYYLVRGWADVPIHTKSVSNYDDAHVGRSPFWEVYALVVDDLKFAFENMRSYDRVTQISTQGAGRPCNWAAQSMLSQVYLTIATLMKHSSDNFWDPDKRQAKYGVRNPDFGGMFRGITSSSTPAQVSEAAFDAALACAEDVIEHGPYTLAPKFTDLFRWTEQEDWLLPERIFVITNSPESDASASNYTAIRSLPKFPAGTQQRTGTNNNYGRWRPSRFVYQKWCATHGGVMGTVADNQDIYVSCGDPRFDATILHDQYYCQQEGAEQWILLYPSAGQVYRRLYDKNSEPFFIKYLDPTYNGNSGRADFYVMRFAEMYLIAAEASANLSSGPGDTYWQKAKDYIEVIHARARHSVPDGQPDAQYPKWADDEFTTEADPQEALINAIFWERVFEMYSEGHEYWDTHRMGAGWLAENIAKPLTAFLLLPEQQLESRTAATPGTLNYCIALYGSNTPPYRTASSELRGSLLLEFPNDEIVHNQAISIEDAANDFAVVKP